MWADPVHGRCAGARVRGTSFVTPGPPLVLGILSAPGTRASTPEGCVASVLEASSSFPRGLPVDDLPAAAPSPLLSRGTPPSALGSLNSPSPVRVLRLRWEGPSPRLCRPDAQRQGGAVAESSASQVPSATLLLSGALEWLIYAQADALDLCSRQLKPSPAAGRPVPTGHTGRTMCPWITLGGRVHGSHWADHVPTDHTGWTTCPWITPGRPRAHRSRWVDHMTMDHTGQTM